MSDTDEPFVEPDTPASSAQPEVTLPAASIEVVKESFDPPAASLESIKASEPERRDVVTGAQSNQGTAPTAPNDPPASVETVRKGLSSDQTQKG